MGATAQMGQKSEMHTEQVQARLLAWAPQGVPSGAQATGQPGTVLVGLQLTHPPHWHTYWKNSGDSGLPTELQWTLPPGVMAGDIAWPVARHLGRATISPDNVAVAATGNGPFEVMTLFHDGEAVPDELRQAMARLLNGTPRPAVQNEGGE